MAEAYQWTAEDDRLLRAAVKSGDSPDAIKDWFGVSADDVRSRCRQLGLKIAKPAAPGAQTQQLSVRLQRADVAFIKKNYADPNGASVAQAVRSLIENLVKDDRAAHGGQ